MIDPNIMGDDSKPENNNFIWFTVFLILSVLMLALTVNGFVALISGDECDKNEIAITQPLTNNKGIKDEI